MNILEEVIMRQNRHQFIYGYNNSERQLLIDNLSNSYSLKINVDNPIAIYLRDFNMELNHLSNDKIKLYSVAREYLSFYIIHSVLNQVLENSIIPKENIDKFLTKINHVYLSFGFNEVSSLKELLVVLNESMEFYKNYYKKEYANISDLRIPFLDLTMLIKNIKKMIKTDSYFAIIINGDNISNVAKLAINSLLASRINKDISMKIFCEPGSWDINYDFSGNVINSIHDYGIVNFDDSEREYTRTLKNKLGGSNEV